MLLDGSALGGEMPSPLVVWGWALHGQGVSGAWGEVVLSLGSPSSQGVSHMASQMESRRLEVGTGCRWVVEGVEGRAAARTVLEEWSGVELVSAKRTG